MKCRKCQKSLLSTEKPGVPVVDVEVHLAECQACRAFQRRLLLIESNVPRLPAPASKAKERLLRTILELSAAPAPVECPLPPSPALLVLAGQATQSPDDRHKGSQDIADDGQHVEYGCGQNRDEADHVLAVRESTVDQGAQQTQSDQQMIKTLVESALKLGDEEDPTKRANSQMLTTVAGMMDFVDKQLERLAKMDLSPEEKQDVQRLRALSSVMGVELASLTASWATGDRQHATRYHETREKAWAGLSEVLGR